MLSVLTPNCFWITGIATFTMLVSRIDMNMPMIRTTRGRPHPLAGRCTSGSGLSGGGGGDDGGPGVPDLVDAAGAGRATTAVAVLPSVLSVRSVSTTPAALAPPVPDVDITAPRSSCWSRAALTGRYKWGLSPAYLASLITEVGMGPRFGL